MNSGRPCWKQENAKESTKIPQNANNRPFFFFELSCILPSKIQSIYSFMFSGANIRA